MFQNYPNIRFFLFFLLGLAAVVAAFYYLPSLPLSSYPYFIYGTMAFVVGLPLLRFLFSRADIVSLMVPDASGLGVHLIGRYYTSGGESVDGAITFIHLFVSLDSGKLYRNQFGRYSDRKAPTSQISDIDSLLKFKDFKKSLKKLSERAGFELKFSEGIPPKTYTVAQRKKNLEDKDIRLAKEGGTIFVSSKEKSPVHLSLIFPNRNVVWTRKIRGKWYDRISQPLQIGNTLCCITQMNSFPSEVFCLYVIDTGSGKVRWKKTF